MKLAFINNNGAGHFTQSKFFPEHKPYVMDSLKLYYRKDGLNYSKTIFRNFFSILTFIKEIVKAIRYVNKHKPEVIYNFYEPLTYFVFPFIKHSCKIISVANQFTIDSKTTPRKLKGIEYYVTLVLNYLSSSKADTIYRLSPFDFPDTLNYFKRELEEIETMDSGHVLVYVKSTKGLSKFLPRDKKVIVYTNSPHKMIASNITYRKFDEKQFMEDLASCSYVIGNAGMNLITECSVLKKHLKMIPVQFEQRFNAYYAQKEFGFEILGK